MHAAQLLRNNSVCVPVPVEAVCVQAEELVELTLQALEGKITPVMAKFDCRMIEVCPTSQEPMRGFTDRMMALEAHSELSRLSKLPQHTPVRVPACLPPLCLPPAPACLPAFYLYALFHCFLSLSICRFQSLSCCVRVYGHVHLNRCTICTNINMCLYCGLYINDMSM
eukprot:COSAG06_NODE_1985_length_7908_cov_11.907671_4_plen_168_part_00